MVDNSGAIVRVVYNHAVAQNPCRIQAIYTRTVSPRYAIEYVLI
jgi:phosphatidate phosphatase APP1